ncbi:type I 3-dehydroquinate dehydratase [Phorcysia thermohydrogeniphila]|uniref:3-dehydroquinate dehydratase n=1 Tax=Phorcysia thermohydrogeniphila TaxID=936138 RepID=A0A4R1G6R8_9BACT|nr:type I 3-dehydroquinate dehydratase [Phorcysia thermohydrogeniphila]TCK03404.1 3-dehydroquinate dehydratase [Phorcysia thermohydrogeniphila]
MQIGTVELGKTPRVIVALSGENLKGNLEKARELKVDLIEARLDLLSDVSKESFRSFLDAVADFGFYSVSTIRPVWEGGKFKGSEEERLELFKLAVSHPATGAVDVELRAKILPYVKEMVEKERKVLIVSYHDFEKTPSKSEIEDILGRAKDAGADIVKVAFAGREPSDATRVCCVLENFDHPKVFMVMGEVGKFTRVVGFSFGSLLTYTFFGEPVAPGQIEAEKLIRLLCEFYPEYSKEKERFLHPAIEEVL